MDKESFQLKNQFGQFYSGGPILFVTHNRKLFFPTQNSVSVIDLVNGKIEPLNFRSRDIINTMDIDKSGKFLSIIDKTNLLLIIDIEKKRIKNKLLLKGYSFSCKWSPRGKYLALTISNHVQVWKIDFSEKNTQSFCQLARTYSNHFNEIVSIDWNFSGNFLISASLDFTIKIIPFRKNTRFKEINLTGFMERILSVKFFNFSNHFLALCENNTLYKIELFKKKEKEKENKNFQILDKNLIFKIKLKNKKSMATSFWIHPFSKILFFGFSTGILIIYNLTKFSEKKHKKHFKNFQIKKIQKISFSENFISYISNFSICLNARFLSFANLKKGKIVVYDREKEEIKIVYQKFFENPSCLAVSPNNKLIIIGDNKGKITIWSIKTGFCILKFSNHLLAINKVSFFKFFSRLAISTSKDGTLKIYDLKKCIVIRTFSCSFDKKNFDSLAINYSGFFIASSCQKTYKIYIWSIKKGVLIEILNGHESYINELFFLEKNLKILSSSWDKTFRIWEFEDYNKSNYNCICEIFRTDGKILGTCLNPNSKEIAFFIQNYGFLFFNLILKKSVFRIKNNFKKDFITLNLSENIFTNLAMTYSYDGEKFFFSLGEGQVYCLNNSMTLNKNVFQDLSGDDIFTEINFPELSLKKKNLSNRNFTNQIKNFIPSKKNDCYFILSSSVFFYSLKFEKKEKVETESKTSRVQKNNSILRKTMKWFFFKRNFYFSFFFIQIFEKLFLILRKTTQPTTTKFSFFDECKKNFVQKKISFFFELRKIFFKDGKNSNQKKNFFKNKIFRKKTKILKKLNYLKFKIFFLI